MFKFCLPSAILKLMKAYTTMALSGQSNLVRRYLQIIADFQLFIAEMDVTEIILASHSHVFLSRL
jgi:hypothetical protein